MKLILSRKGFDSGYGGYPSPVLPDGTLLSMPIPGGSSLKFSDIHYNGITYNSILEQLTGKKTHEDSHCHLDPDIRPKVRLCEINGWCPAFGQIDAAQTHLSNQEVGIGDIFLFFGWFKKTMYSSKGELCYEKGAPDIHIIYGYMQIGKIIKNEEVHRFSWHPHGEKDFISRANNTLYLPSENLEINGSKMKKPGYGTFSYSNKLVLTAEGMTRTRWRVPEWFNDVSISYHTKRSHKKGYFQSAYKGQEFVISDNTNNIAWVLSLIGE